MSAALSVWLIVTAASPDIAATAAVAGLGWIVWRSGRAFSA
jgi:hypothetical protein